MKVFIMPHWNSPYTKLLANALRDLGVNPILAPIYKFRLFWYTIWLNGWPDVIHIQWQHQFFVGSSWLFTIVSTFIFFVQLISLRLLGIRFVWTIHNIINHEQEKAGWELAACQLLARLVNQLIVHCETAKTEVSQAYKIPLDKITVIPHGTFAPLFADTSSQSKEIARRKLRLDSEQKVFLYFGLIRTYKGVDDLLLAFNRLNAPQAQLLIVGKVKTDNLLAEINTLAEQDKRVVTRFEFISDQDLATYICAADFVVLPYKRSLTSGALSPTAVYQRPIIAPKLGCLAEVPAAGALLYDPNNPNGLYHCLQEALSASSELMGHALHQYDAQFCWSDIAARTAHLYQ